MSEQEEGTVSREDWKLQEQLYQSHTADAPGRGYDDIEHLKQQYIDGELTEAEFEARLEQLDSLEESSGRAPSDPVHRMTVQDGSKAPSKHLLWGFSVGAALVLAIAAFAALYWGTIFLAVVLFIVALAMFVLPLELRD